MAHASNLLDPVTLKGGYLSFEGFDTGNRNYGQGLWRLVYLEGLTDRQAASMRSINTI